MLGLLLRLAVFAVALIGLVLLFFYAAVVAVIFIPVVMILFFLLRKKGVITWTTVDVRTSPREPHGAPPVIDHDPNDVTVQRKD